MTIYQRGIIWKRQARKFVVRFKAVRRDNGAHVIVNTGAYGRSWKNAMRWVWTRYTPEYSHFGKIINVYPHDNCRRNWRIAFQKTKFPPNTFSP